MSLYKFRDSLQLPNTAKVDRDNCVINGVKVCGSKSKNGRRYSPSALRNACRLYENARVFVDHPEGDSNARKFSERFGRLVNVKPDADGGLSADLRYNPMHRDAEQFLYLAENDPEGMGLSHNAEGRGSRDSNGDILVEEITRVHSVDLVDGPATTFSLYEQEIPMDPVTDPMAGGDVGGDVNSKLASLASDFAAHPEWDKATKIKKLKSLIELMEDADTDGDGQPDSGEDTPEPEMMEQLGRFKSAPVRTAYRHLLREQCRKEAAAKLKPELITVVFLEQLVETKPEKRAKLIEDRANIGKAAVLRENAEQPRSVETPAAKPLDPKEIAASIDWK